jgi:hypothetical protein
MDELVDATDGNHTESYFGRTGTRGVFVNANTLASEDSSSVERRIISSQTRLGDAGK